MKSHGSEHSWEADCCVLGMAASGPLLEERLVKLQRAPNWSRRKLLGAGVTLLALTPLALVPWRVGAQEAGPAGTPLSQQWEDLLLLEAARYLRLTSGQLQQIRPIARVTDERLRKLQDQESKTQATLQRITDRQRAALLAGRTVSLDEQANALLLEKGLRPARERAALEIATYAAPRLARLLSPEQIARAFLLTNGEMPANVAKRPALLDPQSGFVLTSVEQSTARAAAVRRVLSRNYPPAVADALSRPATNGFILFDGDQKLLASTLTERRITRDYPVYGEQLAPAGAAVANELTLTYSPLRPTPPTGVDKAVFETAQRAAARLEKFPALADELVSRGTPADHVDAVTHLARRLFTSPRWKPVVEERLQRGGIVIEEDAVAPEPG